MSEYSFVEKPFLDQLAALGWTVIDQGPAIPTDLAKSLRSSFGEVSLREVFNRSVRSLNAAGDGREWLTDKQIDDLQPTPTATAAFRDFYRDKGLLRINQRVNHFKSQMGVEPKSVRVMELQNRWASWTPGGNVNFHWKCMMAPVTVLDYLVVHELAHLLVPDHSPKFWTTVEKILADYAERKTWLRFNGASLDL